MTNNTISFLYKFTVLTLLVSFAPTIFVYANHNDEDNNMWWGISSSTERKIDDLDNDPVEDLNIPILLNVDVEDLTDTWGDARSGGRTHEGIDIFAPRGAFIVSPTDAVVTRIDYGDSGGKVVYTANPGGETFYYAHLEDYKDGLDEGDELEKGDLIGFVGNSGNASFASPHLHFTIYGEDGAENPFPRLVEEWTLEERIDSLEKIVNDADDEDEMAEELVLQYRAIFLEAQKENINLSEEVEDALEKGIAVPESVAVVLTRDLRFGMRGADITWVQNFLIAENSGPSAVLLGEVGATGYFGTLTKNAVIEYQKGAGLTADGVIGPKTRASIDASV